jgi:hypothetical protein
MNGGSSPRTPRSFGRRHSQGGWRCEGPWGNCFSIMLARHLEGPYIAVRIDTHHQSDDLTISSSADDQRRPSCQHGRMDMMGPGFVSPHVESLLSSACCFDTRIASGACLCFPVFSVACIQRVLFWWTLSLISPPGSQMMGWKKIHVFCFSRLNASLKFSTTHLIHLFLAAWKSPAFFGDGRQKAFFLGR